MSTLKEDFPDEVAALERKHAGRCLEPSEIRDLLTPETPLRIVGGNVQFLLEGKWVTGSRTDLCDRIWTHVVFADDDLEEAKEHWLSDREWYGAILSERDGLIVIDSMTDG